MQKNKIIVPLNAENKKRNSNSINNRRIIFGIILFMIIPYIMMHNSNKRDNTNKKTESSEEIQRRIPSSFELIALEKCRKEIERKDLINRIGRDEWNASFKKNQSILEKRKLIKSFTWRTAWPGNLAVANIAFKNKSSVDISNIIVVFKFYGESGGLLREIHKFIPIVLKAGKMRTLRDITVGFIPDFSTNMSCEIL
jgi:hypothetical protein